VAAEGQAPARPDRHDFGNQGHADFAFAFGHPDATSPPFCWGKPLALMMSRSEIDEHFGEMDTSRATRPPRH